MSLVAQENQQVILEGTASCCQKCLASSHEQLQLTEHQAERVRRGSHTQILSPSPSSFCSILRLAGIPRHICCIFRILLSLHPSGLSAAPCRSAAKPAATARGLLCVNTAQPAASCQQHADSSPDLFSDSGAMESNSY